MKWLVFGFIPFIVAMTPVYIEHRDLDAVDEEFKNVYLQVQPKNFRVVESTPNLTDLQDGEMVVVSSQSVKRGFVKVMFRMNQEIYAIDVSCVTIRR